ncbi:hypothetical protein ACIA5G_00220 [Amycolatopsis sp. NPDC051758]|uniref:hypothetical protein n=1 Tax=Amycolatopsis sp. NPDC051758 TaxID=3363935 RepID=UPI00379EA49B
MGRTLSRVAGIVFAGALAAVVAAPAALAQTDTTTAPSTTETSTSETTTTTAPSTSETTTSSPVTTTTSAAPTSDVTTTTTPVTSTTSTSATSEPPVDDPNYQDAVGHGFVGLGGEGILVVACASGKVGGILSLNLSVTSGPDQDESDGRYWNYSVTVSTPPSGPTARFAFTCDGVEGIGIVEFEQEQPPTSSSSTPTTTSAAPSSSAPVTTAPVTTATSAAPGNSAPKAQVKVAPKGGIETGFGGTAG